MNTPFIDIVVHDEELRAALNALGQNVRNKVMRPAIRKAMATVKKAAKANAPYKTGSLRDGKVDPRSGKKRGGIKVYVNKARANGEVYGVLKGLSPHSHLIEYGFDHITKTGTKHVPARPFLRPAMDEHHDEALGYITDYLDKAWKEAGGK